MTSDEARYHHGSHRKLLWDQPGPPATDAGVGLLSPATPAKACVDAVLVPTARHPASLIAAVGLAQALNCTLVTLHSKKWTSAQAAVARFGSDVDLLAIDVPEQSRLRLPQWETSAKLAGTIFERRTDLSAKRNLALTLSRMLGWSRIVFLDDDITGLNPEDFRRAGELLGMYNAVGLQIGGFPDNSVVCHAYRKAGGTQHQFVGGGALAVNLDRSRSFFPDIYNDDWFFLLDADKWLQPTAITGLVKQHPYDPYRIERARAEELGDVLAEGLYWLLDQDRSIMDADERHWAQFLCKRRKFIEKVVAMVRADDALKDDVKERMIAALKASHGRLSRITAEFCASYLRAWAADRQRWQQHLEQLPANLQREAALARLFQPQTAGLSREVRSQQGPRVGHGQDRRAVLAGRS